MVSRRAALYRASRGPSRFHELCPGRTYYRSRQAAAEAAAEVGPASRPKPCLRCRGWHLGEGPGAVA